MKAIISYLVAWRYVAYSIDVWMLLEDLTPLFQNARYRSCGIEKGLQDRHEYTITKVLNIEVFGRNIPLIRLRNPHGDSQEWTGDWSDK